MMHNGKISIWISSDQYIFPPAIKQFGIFPDQIIFIRVQKQKEALWIMEEALKCEGLAAVIGDISTIDFTASRRLQLAVEKSRVTGMLIRNQMKTFNSSAALARWKITSLPSLPVDGLPGVGHPRWKVDLSKVRNGKPGSWNIEWKSGRFNEVLPEVATYQESYNLKVG
jgi:protein ImuA